MRRACAIGLALGFGLGDARGDHLDDGERSRAGVAAAGILPAGAWAEVTGAGGGASAWLEVPVSPRVIVTARAGVVVHAPATVTAGARLTLIEVPVLGGARLELARLGRLRVRASGELGLVVAHERVALGGVTEGDAGLRLGGALSIGLALGAAAVDLGPWFADVTDARHTAGAQLTLGVRLRSW